MKILFFAAAVLAVGCAAPVAETRASRDRLNCIFAAEYEGHFTDAQRLKMVKACR